VTGREYDDVTVKFEFSVVNILTIVYQQLNIRIHQCNITTRNQQEWTNNVVFSQCFTRYKTSINNLSYTHSARSHKQLKCSNYILHVETSAVVVMRRR